MAEVFDIWDSATNTETVQRMLTTALEDDNLVGPSIAPLVDVRDRRIKRGSIEIEAFGIAQIKARNAAPAIFTPAIDFDERWIELIHIDEMSPIEEAEWHDLTGDNEYLRNRAGVAILQRARIIQIRNERRTEWLRWQAFQDTLTGVPLADSGNPAQTIKVSYGADPANTVDVSDWTNRTTSTPITDIRTGQKALFDTLGYWGSNIYMDSNEFENVQYSKQVRDLLKPVVGTAGTDFTIPSREQVEKLLYSEDSVDARGDVTGTTRLVITNAGYRAEGQLTNRGRNAITTYKPTNKVLITTNPTIGGERIADMPNGRVAIKNGAAQPYWVQGPASETIVSANPPYTQYSRMACARVPRINFPNAFMWLLTGP